MKKIIRIKAKDLLKGIGVFLAILLLIYAFLPSVMLSIANRYHRQGNLLIAKAYYDRMDRFFPNRSATAEALERATQIADNHNLLMISSTGVGSTSHIGGTISKETEAYYKKLVDRFPHTWQGKRAKVELTSQEIKHLISEDKIEEAFSLMKHHYETINANTSTNYWDPSVALEAVTALKSKGLYTEGLDILKYMMEDDENHQNTDVYELTADLYSFLGNKQEAEKYYARLLEMHNENIQMELQYSDQEHREGITSYYAEKKEEVLRKLASLKDTASEYGAITGTIALKDQPLRSIPVFIQPQRDPRGGTMSGVTYDSIWVLSDEQGQFNFNYVEPGRYSLGFVVDLDVVGDVVLKGGFFPKSTIYVDEEEKQHWDFQLVDTLNVLSPTDHEKITGDTIHFKWEPFEEAAYYTLELGAYSLNGSGSYSTNYSERKFYTNEAILSIDELTYFPSGMTFDEEGPTPDSFFGFGHPKGKYFWGVLAHDEDGNILTSSRGYLKGQNTDFAFEERSIRLGDELLLKRKFAEAIAAYEEDLKVNPNDVYALSMLGKLYGLSYGNIEKYPYSDIDKAVNYYERLYQLTDNPRFLKDTIELLYQEKKNYHNVLQLLEVLEEKEDLKPWHQRYRVMIYSHEGNYEAALQELLTMDTKYHGLEASLRIITNNFTGIQLQERDILEEKWVAALQQYEETYASMDMDLKENIRKSTPLEALKLLENRDLTPHKALLQLALKVVEPTSSIYEYEALLEYTNKYKSIDPVANEILEGMFAIPIRYYN
ncbi:Tetratricopeptide repeat-containing protein [Anaerovirgula multivorans]|uniref:Tetratricopeptide repeat-containing protein n=1 Tax=Anaerovirgula multivorans TaxID=312168 RepID=A0A239AG95_9FIRM|nr:tetratricopeptide repeat protein [Anaerovirgula multivorans]SNR94570.1 Tetratricopeptide repeat-containing protein [Anaerovirgula multivorans]